MASVGRPAVYVYFTDIGLGVSDETPKKETPGSRSDGRAVGVYDFLVGGGDNDVKSLPQGPSGPEEGA